VPSVCGFSRTASTLNEYLFPLRHLIPGRRISVPRCTLWVHHTLWYLTRAFEYVHIVLCVYTHSLQKVHLSILEVAARVSRRDRPLFSARETKEMTDWRAHRAVCILRPFVHARDRGFWFSIMDFYVPGRSSILSLYSTLQQMSQNVNKIKYNSTTLIVKN
jgi:hypothetical protein